ncbi:Thromboxane-A synthase [Physocladia obscura]|uniref:Thromboxane-A synthase n=1 Tax=Physocladia obscura TaxID=109957 RepID=A0AAD5XAK0_9FUNG|nr:Thromboxane-A synthase [Physocladia obscura]
MVNLTTVLSAVAAAAVVIPSLLFLRISIWIHQKDVNELSETRKIPNLSTLGRLKETWEMIVGGVPHKARAEEMRKIGLLKTLNDFQQKIQRDIWWFHFSGPKNNKWFAKFVTSETVHQRWRPSDKSVVHAIEGESIGWGTGESYAQINGVIGAAFRGQKPYSAGYIKSHVAELATEVRKIEIGAKQRVFQVNVNDLARRFFFDVTTDAFMAHKMKALSTDCSFFDYFDRLRQIPVVTPESKKLIDACNTQIKDLISNRATAIESGEFKVETNPDILSLVAQALQDGNFSERQATCTISNIFTAGTLNSAMHAQFVLLHLAYDQAIQDKVRKEVTTVMDGDFPNDEKPLEYTTWTVKESLRLYENGTFPLPRVAAHNITLENGGVIPKGSFMGVSLLATHRDATYFPEPDVFKPERWDSNNLAPFSFIPFGVGSRACPAANMGLVNVAVFVAFIVQNYKITLPPNSAHRKGINFNYALRGNMCLEKI